MNNKIYKIGFFCLIPLVLIGLLITFYAPYQKHLPQYIEGLGQFSGTFLGVITGICITYIVQNISNTQNKKQTIKNFIFEMELNIEKLDSWLQELAKYRNAVNGDALHNYHGYFKLSSFIGVIANQLHLSGEAYNILTREQFKQLQEMYNEIDIHGETYLNEEISKNKTDFISHRNDQDWVGRIKPNTVQQIDFWERKFKTHIKTLSSIAENLRNIAN